MDVLKLCIVFVVIIALIKLKLPLWVAIFSATLSLGLMFWISPSVFIKTMWSGASAPATLKLLLTTYLLSFLQKLMNSRNMLANAEGSISSLLQNRRLGAAIIPFTMGLLPSPASILIAGPMNEKVAGKYLSREDLAFVTTYYRHVPESFLPLYTNVVLMSTISGVPVWQFVLYMLPYTILNMTVPYLIYLRKIPKGSDAPKGRSKLEDIKSILKNLWPVFFIIAIILIFKIETYIGALLTAALAVIFMKIRPSELPKFFRMAVDKNMLLSMLFVMMFTKVIAYTGVASRLQQAMDVLPIPTFLIFALVFFFGAVFCNFSTMIPITIPMAMSVLPSPLAALIMLASVGHLASQVCPTHVCILMCCEYFNVKLDAVIKRTIPVIAIMMVFTFGIYLGMTSIM